MTRPRRVFIRTYGCQMNVYDSGRMLELLRAQGFAPAAAPEDADLVILNTCHIRGKAAEKVYSELGRLRLLKESRGKGGRRMALAVAGCVAQAEGEAVFARAPAVDFIFGPQAVARLPALVERFDAGERGMAELDFPAQDKFDAMDARARPAPRAPVSAFLAVQEGCDRFCSFCVVPYTRGAEYSRPVSRILREARRLAERGAREITLLGQNVNAWRGEGPDGREWPLERLLEALARIDGLERLRFTTSHPGDMREGLIAAFAENEKLMPFLHLPLQSGSDRILRAMNRGHTVADYLRLVEKIRAAREDIALSGDFIVGFPGEREEDFAATMAAAAEAGYAQAYSFMYSPRPGTPAARAEDQVPQEEKHARLARLQELLARQQEDFNARFEGRVFDILLEKPGRREGQLVGRSPWLQAVHVDARGRAIGDLVAVRVERAGKNSLSAHIMDGAAAAEEAGRGAN